MKKLIQLTTCVVTAGFLLSGCGTRSYTQDSGEAGGNSIKVACENDRITITKLDSKSMMSIADHLVTGTAWRGAGVDVAYVNPGRHELELHWKDGDSYVNSAVWFVAEPGKSYSICSEEHLKKSFWTGESGRVGLFVKEVESGQKVGGRL
jgi:hypothetical protein